jgi:hypothetical protein
MFDRSKIGVQLDRGAGSCRICNWSTRPAASVGCGWHQPTSHCACFQVIIRDVEVRACVARYLLLPGRLRAGAPEAPATGWAAFNMSTAAPATAYMYSWCAAMHACVRLACMRGQVWGWGLTVYCVLVPSHHHHVTQSRHSINAIGPAPLWSGRKREHCSIMFATITHIPSLHKILSNTPRNHPAPPPTTPNIIRHKTQQLGRSIRQ